MTDFPSFSDRSDSRIVFVRDVKTADLPQEIRDRTGGQERLYAIQAESGEVLALVPDRQQAFAVARRNEFTPVSAH
jgi:hypothetical protein